jgi:MFS family permease
VNIISVAHGAALGWMSPYIPYLRSESTHFSTGPIDSDDLSWIGASISIGGFFGAIIFGKIAQWFGKRSALIVLVFPHFAFWLIVLSSTQIYHLYIARIFAGITGGGTLRTISLYIAEISENKIRGKLGSYMMLFLCLGTLLIFIAGNYLSFFSVPLVMMFLPTVYFISVLFLHDTPASLISKHNFDGAWESMKFYRSCGTDSDLAENYREEFDLLKKKSDDGDYEEPKLSDYSKRD